MTPSLFHRGLAPRLVAAALYGAFAFGAVALLLGPSGPRPAGSAVGATPPPSTIPLVPVASQATICIESIAPVAAWSIRIDGAASEPRQSSPTAWIADATLDSGSGLVIDAVPAADGTTGANALRIRIAGTETARDHTFWCGREWTVATSVGDLARAAGPIDPADLP